MKKKIINLILGIAMSIILMVIIFQKFDFAEFWQKMLHIDLKLILLFFFIFILLIAIRTIRWLFIAQIKLNYKNIYLLFETISIAGLLNSLLPFGAGEIYRVNEMKVLKKSGFGNAASTIILERMIDMILLFVMVLTLTFFLPFPNWVRNILILSGTIITIFILILIFVKQEMIKSLIIEKKTNNKILNFIFKFIHNILKGFEEFKKSDKKFHIILLTILVWIVSAFAVFVKGKMLSLDFSVFVIITSMSLLNISTIIPATPGMFGTYHAAVYASLSIWKFNSMDCENYALFAHGSNFIIMILIGGFLWLMKLVRMAMIKNGT